MALDISATSPRVQYTVGSSSTTTFAYGFPIFQEADLKVYVDSTLKTLTTHYSVTGEGTTSGGNVVFGSGLTNCTVTIFRDVEIARTTDFPTSGSFQVGSLNTELDTITAVQQELEDKINRSVRLDDEDSAVAMTLPLKADRIGKILGFNSSTGVPESFVYLTNENTVALDGLTAGTVLASKYVLVDSNKDIGTFRNITLSGELDAGSLDVSGDADIDGTLEADAITIGGITLAETIADTVGAMVSSNTETGITVDYQDGDNTLDFALGASQTTITSLLATDIKIGEDNETKIDFETADTINFYAGNEKQLILTDGALTPGSNAILDLGSDALEFKDAYFDGTVEADAITIGGVTLAETIADTVGAMVGSNTETGIAVTYEDSDNTLDFVIGAGSIVNSMLADDAVGADELASNAVVTASIVADAVTGAKIADDQIDSEHYIDGSIDTAHIADDQITQAKMADDAIGADQLASSAVVTASIVDDNVTQAKIADDAVGADQLASSAVVTASIVDNAVTLAKMAGLARGKLITGDSSGDPSALAIGTNGQYLKSDGSDLVWGSATVSGLACDDLTVGDSAVTLSTSSGNITIDAQGNDTDIIFKGTDGSSDTTFLTLDGSDAGTATFNHDVKLIDDGKLTFGTGDDLTIRHDSSNNYSYIEESGSGGLVIKATDLYFQNAAGTANTAFFQDGGKVELRYNGSTKFETSNTGIEVTGVGSFGSLDISGAIDVDGTSNLDVVDIDGALTQDGGVVFNEDSADVDFRVESNGNANMFKVDGGDNKIYIGHAADQAYDAGFTPAVQIAQVGNTVYGGIGLSHYSNDAEGSVLVMGSGRATSVTGTTIVADDDMLGRIDFQGMDGSDFETGAIIMANVDGTPGSGDMPGRLTFWTTADGANAATERMRVDNVGTTTIFAGSSPLVLGRNNSSGGVTCVSFNNSSTAVSSISGQCFRIMGDGDVENTNNAYGAISDIKLKENIADASSQWDDIKAVKVKNFSYKKDELDNANMIGVIAQDLEASGMSGLITERHDFEDGKDLETMSKSVKYSVLYMKAVKALQESMTRIETLEAKVKALEDA